MSNPADEFAHLIKLLSAQQQEVRVFAYGHIASYDPVLHRVNVLFPSICDETGTPALSPWMPLGTPWAGGGFGLQVAPMGGASVQNPTAGEQVVVLLMDNKRGVTAAAFMTYNQTELPHLPGILAGEAILQHSSGSFLRFHSNGDIEQNTQGKSIIIAQGDVDVTSMGNINATADNVTVTATGNATVTATGTASVTAPSINLGDGGSLLSALTSASADIYNSHTHTDPQGGTVGPATPQITASGMTSIVKVG